MLRSFALIFPLAAICLGQSDSHPKEPAASERKDEDAPQIPVLYQSVVITATPVEPQIDRRNDEVFRQTLFSRDDQVFHLLAAGIDAGQHEGGGKVDRGPAVRL